MTKTIALCGVCAEIAHALEIQIENSIIWFADEPGCKGDVKLAYSLRDGQRIGLCIVGYPGAVGLTSCDYLRKQDKTLPILWLCNLTEFEPEAKRLNVDFYCKGSPDEEISVQDIVRVIKIKSLKD